MGDPPPGTTPPAPPPGPTVEPVGDDDAWLDERDAVVDSTMLDDVEVVLVVVERVVLTVDGDPEGTTSVVLEPASDVSSAADVDVESVVEGEVESVLDGGVDGVRDGCEGDWVVDGAVVGELDAAEEPLVDSDADGDSDGN